MEQNLHPTETPPPKQFVLPERNPVTHAAHRREVWWQITFPLLIGGLLLLAVLVGVIVAAVGANQGVSRWADVSLIWLLLPVLPMAFLLLVVTAGITYGITALLRVFPGYARLVQDYFLLFEAKVKEIDDRIVEPVLKLRAWQIGIQQARTSVQEQMSELLQDEQS